MVYISAEISPLLFMLFNILRVVDNPKQDIPLLSVLMSPVFGFTADDPGPINPAFHKVIFNDEVVFPYGMGFSFE